MSYNLYLEPVKKANPYNNFKRFMQEDVEAIGKLYPDTSNKVIGLEFGRTHRSIKNLAAKYNWQKSKEYMKSKPGCYRKGNTPWNKNKKGYMGSNRTSFKKGNKSWNYLPIGTVSLRRKKGSKTYKYIKTNEGWILLHRYIWRSFNRKIPDGYVIIFKDSDTLNCDIDNLELISRKENLRRNINREKAAESLRKLWRKEWLHKQYGLQPVSKFGEKIK